MRALGAALQRLLRPERHIVLRLLDDQPVSPADMLAVPRLESAVEGVPGCCEAGRTVDRSGSCPCAGPRTTQFLFYARR